ncbi:hypothetical protein D3C76_1458470 [compost metagenome]
MSPHIYSQDGIAEQYPGSITLRISPVPGIAGKCNDARKRPPAVPRLCRLNMPGMDPCFIKALKADFVYPHSRIWRHFGHRNNLQRFAGILCKDAIPKFVDYSLFQCRFRTAVLEFLLAELYRIHCMLSYSVSAL